jgi:hypothetical protein
LESGTNTAGRITAVGRVVGLLHKVFEINHAENVVDVLPDHRDSGMAAAHRQRRGLPGRLVGLDPHHLGARHHHLAGRGVTQLEHRLDHAALVVGDHTALLGQVDDLAQLDLGGKRAVAEPTTGCQRVTDQDQQPADRGEQHRDRLQRKRGQQRDGVRILTADGAWADTDRDEADHHHDGGRGDQPPTHAEELAQVGDQQHRCGHLARDTQQHNEIDVARPLGHHSDQPHRSGPLIAHQFFDAGHRNRADGGVDRREQPAETDERDRAEQRGYAGHGSSKYRDLSSSRWSFSDWRSW